ncbi:MAG: CAP domain-containing protein [Thermoanaerobaculum sp.]|nr:CAP domain-containing protein [Thermoanaerobaculum sp.]
MVLAVAAGPPEIAELARRQVLQRVNQARHEQGLAPLQRDPLLERVGEVFCQKLLAEGSSGHFAADGVPPYLRYLLAGGTGFHRQNVGSYQTTGSLDPQEVPSLALQLTEAMLAEQPPQDGHRRTLLEPTATSLGVGLAYSRQRLVLVHEVATQLAQVEPPPRVCQPRQRWVFQGKLEPPWQAAAVEVLWEPLPTPGSHQGAASYGYPARRAWFSRVEYLPASRVSVAGAFTVQPGGRFSFPTAAGPHPGVELVLLWARKPGDWAVYPVALSGCVVVDQPASAELQEWLKLVPGEVP